MQKTKKSLITASLLMAIAIAPVPIEARTVTGTANDAARIRTKPVNFNAETTTQRRPPKQTVAPSNVAGTVYQRQRQAQTEAKQIRLTIKNNRQEILALRSTLQHKTREIRRITQAMRSVESWLTESQRTAIQAQTISFGEARAAAINSMNQPVRFGQNESQTILASQRQQIAALNNAIKSADELLFLLKQ